MCFINRQLSKFKLIFKSQYRVIKILIVLSVLATSAESFSQVRCESLFNTENDLIIHGVAGRVHQLSKMYRMLNNKGKLKMYRGVSVDPGSPDFNIDHTSSDGVIWFSPNKNYAISYAVGQYQVRKNKSDPERISLLFEYDVPFKDIYWTHKASEMSEATLSDLKQNDYEAITPAFGEPRKFLKKVYILDSQGRIVGELINSVPKQ